MAPTKKTTLHDTEWELLEVLWNAKRATARDVEAAVERTRGWAYSTVKTLLDRMVEKGLVSARQIGNVWEYTPALRKADAQRRAWAGFLDKAFGGAAAPALEFVARQSKLSKTDIQKLQALLKTMEEDDDA